MRSTCGTDWTMWRLATRSKVLSGCASAKASPASNCRRGASAACLLAGMLHRRGQQLHAQHLRFGQSLGDARAEFAGARAHVEHARIARQPVEVEQRLFLRPDGFDLRGQRANHGFVRHLLALGIEIQVCAVMAAD